MYLLINKISGGVIRIRDSKELHDPVLCFETFSDARDWCCDTNVALESYDVKEISNDPKGIAGALTSISPDEIVLRILRPRKTSE